MRHDRRDVTGSDGAIRSEALETGPITSQNRLLVQDLTLQTDGVYS